MTPRRSLVFLLLGLLLGFGGAQSGFGDTDSCSPIRLDNPQGSMANVPVLDQGKNLDCYAHVAAQLVDAYRFSHGDKRTGIHTSGLMLAVDYSRDVLKTDKFEGGTACAAVDYIKRKGACNSVSLRTRQGETFEYYMTRFAHWQRAVATFDAAWSHYLSAYGIPGATVAQKTCIGTCQNLSGPQLDLKLAPSVEALEKLLKLNEPPAHMDPLTCPAENHFAAQIPACHNYIPPSDNGLPPTPSRLAQIQKEINARLALPNAQPVAIVYCSELLNQGKFYNGRASKSARDSKKSTCSPHDSLVIGRRPNPQTGSCEFLVRNTWGTSCDQEYSGDWQCEGGNIWIDAETLSNNASGLSYLQ